MKALMIALIASAGVLAGCAKEPPTYVASFATPPPIPTHLMKKRHLKECYRKVNKGEGYTVVDLENGSGCYEKQARGAIDQLGDLQGSISDRYRQMDKLKAKQKAKYSKR